MTASHAVEGILSDCLCVPMLCCARQTAARTRPYEQTHTQPLIHRRPDKHTLTSVGVVLPCFNIIVAALVLERSVPIYQAERSFRYACSIYS